MLRKYRLEVIVFIAGIAVMIVELDGSRIIAPYYGTSLYTWTSIIGVILGSLSVGYWLGGKIADRMPTYKNLSIILLISAISIGLVALAKDVALNAFQLIFQDIRAGSVVSSLTFFALPNILLGMVSPYAAKLKLKTISSAGSTVGNLYAISTIGSIVGTFLAGFYLIPAMGNTRILFLVTIILAFLAVFAWAEKYIPKLAIIVFFIILSLSSWSISKANVTRNDADIDTQYSRIHVYSKIDAASGRPIRVMSTDPFGYQSAVFLDKDDDLVFNYTKFFRLGNFFNQNIKNAFMLGGGGYTYPRDFLKKNPSSTIDVVEIDPKVTDLSKSYFNLTDDPRLKTTQEDGRIFLNQNTDKYDAAYIDAFQSITPPFQLTTKESAKKIYERLNPNGVVLVNVISSLSGDNSQFLRSMNSTYQSVFPQVYIFPVTSNEDQNAIQNIILVATKSSDRLVLKSSDPLIDEYLGHIYNQKIDSGLVLTDDYAPVENMVQSLFARI